MRPATLVPLASDAASGPDRFVTFGPDHLAMLALGVAGCVVVGWWGARRRAARGGGHPTYRVAAALLLAVAVPFQVWQWLPENFNRGNSLPFHLSDLSWILAAFALWTANRRAAQVLYFWGLTLVPQAMLTPDLVQVFPNPRYVMFWVMHLAVIWIAVWLTWGTDSRPTWGGWRFAVAATLVWVVVMVPLNELLDTNYGYLNGTPPGGSALDLLPPWPWYLGVLVVGVSAIWALMTWPWVRARIRHRRDPDGTMVGL